MVAACVVWVGPGGPLVAEVICEGGWRSSLVASWLQGLGFEKVYNVPGGMAQWRAADLPVEKGSDQEGFR